MSNLDNFNTCPHCNTPNPTIAKFCFQCGTQLKSNDVPVICSKCHTQNSGKSSYCRTCGSKLLGSGVTKICPRCTNEIDANSTICSKCGFSFVATGVVAPAYHESAPVKPNKKGLFTPKTTVPTERDTAVARVKQGKGNVAGRIYGIFLIIFVLSIAWVLVMPTLFGLLPFGATISNFIPFMKSGDTVFDGQNYIGTLFSIVTTNMPAFLGAGLGQWFTLGTFVLAGLCLVIEFIKGIVLLFTGRQPKKGNTALLIMTVIVALLVLVLYAAQAGWLGFLAPIAPSTSTITPWTIGLGYIFGLPGGMLLCWLLSLIFKMSKRQAQIMTIQR